MSMRRGIIIWLLNCCIMYLLAEESYHRIGGLADVSIGADITNVERNMSFDVGGDAGFVYEYNKKHFLLQINAGINYAYGHVSNRDMSGEWQNMTDSYGDQCIYSWFITNKVDFSQMVNTNMSFLVGGEFNSIVVLTGLKWKYLLYGSTRSNAHLITYGTYPNLIVPLKHMPNHYYVDNLKNSSEKSMNRRYSYDFVYSFEIGYSFNRNRFGLLSINRSSVHRLSIYADISLLNQIPNKQEPLYDFHKTSNYIPDLHLENVSLTHLYQSNVAATNFLRTLCFGVKYTILLELKYDKSCRCLF